MNKSLGTKISEYRRARGIKQDELAEILGVSPQAVSKWENDVCCPDITLLPKLAQTLGVSVDDLLSDREPPKTVVLPAERRRNIEDLTLLVNVNSSDGDKVRVTLPMQLVKIGLEIGMKMPQISGNEALKDIDLAQIIELVERGLYGKLVDVQSADGDIVEISVE